MNIKHNNEILALTVKDATDFFWFNPLIERYFYCYLGTTKIAKFCLLQDGSWGYELEENTLLDYNYVPKNLYYFYGFHTSITLINFIVELLILNKE